MSFIKQASFSSGVNISTPGGDSSKDFNISNPPPDSVSSLDWSSRGDFLAAASWDNQVRVWSVEQTGQSRPISAYVHDAPVLSCRWTKDGSKLLAAGADKMIKLHDLTSGQSIVVGSHEAAIRSVRIFDENHVLTGGLDRMVRGWDLRTSSNTPIFSVDAGERVYSMDCSQNKLVVATAKKKSVQLLDIASMKNGFSEFKVLLDWQIRVVKCFPSGEGFVIASIEGRAAMHDFNETLKDKNFSFKCHRANAPSSVNNITSNNTLGKGMNQTPSVLVFPVHDIAFHPVAQNALVTCGGDGAFHFWDRQARTRLKVFNSAGSGMPITSVSFNRTGSMLAYSPCYDWSRGHGSNVTGSPVSIRIHPVEESDIRQAGALKKR